MYVYLIKNNTTGNFKIGHSKDPEKRLKQLSTGSDAKLSLVHSLKCEKYKPYQVEKRIHRMFMLEKLKGEWYKLSPKAVQIIQEYSTDLELYSLQ